VARLGRSDVSTVTSGTPLARLVGRNGLLSTVERSLANSTSVVLTGPNGVGKTAVLDAVAVDAQARGELVLRATGVEAERWISGTALADLAAQLPGRQINRLDPALRAALEGTRRSDLSTSGRAWVTVLGRCAEMTKVLLLLDDAHWIDSASADVLAFATRRLAGQGVRVVLAWRWSGAPRPVPVVPEPATHLVVPPLTAAELAGLLELHGLPARAATRIHLESAGNPFLALALAGAFVDHSPGHQRTEPLPPVISGLVRSRLSSLPVDTRETLLLCALANEPTVQLLLRAGRVDAEEHLRLATEAGLVLVEDGSIRFTPSSGARVVAAQASGARRYAVHTQLADVVTFQAERDRHLALATSHPDGQFATSLAAAAGVARRRGARGLAAELYLLAADHMPADGDDLRTSWLVQAADAAAVAGQAALVHRAADAVLAADSAPRQRVAVRLSVMQLASQGACHMQETLAAALKDAEHDQASLATVRLWQAWVAAIAGQPALALVEADVAVDLAQQVGDTTIEAMAWSVSAMTARHLGRPDHLERLERGLALPDPQMDGWMHFTPRFQSVRIAVTEDRLEDAHAMLLGMLAQVERGAPEELIGVMGALAEVGARAGRCREAVDFAQRSMRVAADAALSPGPSWYVAAVAELAGGTLEQATAYAQRGASSSEQEGDRIYLRHHLHVLGQAQLRAGRAQEAAQSLLRVQTIERECGICDPANLRWHADLVCALVAAGRLDEARVSLDHARQGVGDRGGGVGVGAQLDRAEALLLAGTGMPTAALDLLAQAATTFESLGQPLEQGHCLLVRAQVERHRRRSSAARSAAGSALELFEAATARPWMEQSARLLAQLDGTAPNARQAPDERDAFDLSGTESRIAALVAHGATNREIAEQLFLSVKTVEATLTRVYRKLGVRSRTQLSRRLASTR